MRTPHSAGVALDAVLNGFRKSFIVYIFICLVGIIFVAPDIDLWFKLKEQDGLGGYIALGACGIGLFIALVAFLVRKIHFTPRWSNGIFIGIFCLLMAVTIGGQVLIVSGALFLPGFDVIYLLEAATGETSLDINQYFSAYPNQLFLLQLFSWLSSTFAATEVEDITRLLVIGNCICSDICMVVSALVVRKVARSNFWSLVAFAVSVLLIGLSPWILVPYSDIYGMLCPSLVLLIYALAPRNFISYTAMSLLTVVGYFIKPTAIFIGIAIVVVELVSFARGSHFYTVPKKLWGLAPSLQLVFGCVLGASLAFAASGAIEQYYKPSIDSDQAFGLAHYAMLGLNADTQGNYSEKDYEFTKSFHDPISRTEGDISRWQKRLEQLGVMGITGLFIEKSLNNYGVGTFSWLDEGHFVEEIYGNNRELIDLFGLSPTEQEVSVPYAQFRIFRQVLWFFVLIGILFGALSRYVGKTELVITLSLLALSMFLMIFESRARYLILYLPCFVVLSTLGWHRLSVRFEALRQKSTALKSLKVGHL